MKKLNIAILGQGRSGRDIHGKYLLTRTDQYNVAYVVEPLENRREIAQKIADETGVENHLNCVEGNSHQAI